MRLNLKGEKYKYHPQYYKFEDDFLVYPPKYSVSRRGKIYNKNEWVDCNFHIVSIGSNPVMYVSPSGWVKDGMSELGPVDEQGFFDIIYLGQLDVIKINLYDYFFHARIETLKIYDNLKSIKKTLRYFLWAFIFSMLYFLINYFSENYLMDLIGESNVAQSLILFFTLATVINIFRPFVLRNELDIEQVNELISKRQEELVKNSDFYKNKYSKRTKY